MYFKVFGGVKNSEIYFKVFGGCKEYSSTHQNTIGFTTFRTVNMHGTKQEREGFTLLVINTLFEVFCISSKRHFSPKVNILGFT